MHIAFIGDFLDLSTMQWAVLCAGMFLLLFPGGRLLSSKVRLRTLESFHSLENSPHGRPWWWVPVLWLDPVRAFAGAWLLLHALGLDLLKSPPQLALWTAVIVLVPAVILQCLTTREPNALLAPMGFVGGLILVLLPLSVALPTIVLAFLAMLAFHHFHLFFGTGSLVTVGLGFVLQVEPWRFALGGGVLLLPILFSMATGRALELPTRLVEKRLLAARPPQRPQY